MKTNEQKELIQHLRKENERLTSLVEQWKSMFEKWRNLYYQAKQDKKMYKRISGLQ